MKSTVYLFCRISPLEPEGTTRASCSWTAVVVDRTVGLAPRGLGRHRLGVGPNAWIPRAARCRPCAVPHARAHLQEKRGTTLAPLPRWLLPHPFADDLVHDRFHKACAEALPVAIARAIVWHEIGVVLDGRVELLDGLQQFPGWCILTGGDSALASALDGLHDLEGVVYIPMPQAPFEPLEFLADGRTDLVGHLLIAGRLWEAFGGLLHAGEAHGHRQPIEPMLGLGMVVELVFTYSCAALREKRDLLVPLVALGLEHREAPACGFGLVGLDKSHTLAGDGRFSLFPPVQRKAAPARDPLKAALLPLRFDGAPINADGPRPIWDGPGLPVTWTPINQGDLLVVKSVLQAWRQREDMVANRHRFQRLIEREDSLSVAERSF